ncbi:MAG TPA: ABC transporter permease, partial [Verrucomicrobiae bacterium]|nr:ABC transporter permease [Verrucomicrobiae bacterium]
GISREEALRRARMEFGGVERVKEECRESRGVHFVESLLQDLRFALRMLRKSPGFSTIAVLTLALGIGANTAIFSVVNTVLLKPLPYPNPAQLVKMWRTHGTWTGSISVPDFKDWQSQNTSFDGMSLYDSARFNLRGQNEPQAVEGARVSPNFFAVMQKPLFLGRGFAAGEDQAGANRVAVLSYELWASQFGKDRNLIGKTVQLSGASYTVVGIAAPNFHFPHPETELWVPLTPLKEQMSRSAHDFIGIGRVKPGISISQARKQLNAISDRLAKTYPDTDAQLGALLIPLKDATVGGIRSSLLIVFAIIGFVFLIACANVSCYVLSRAEARRREVAIRAALGAGRGRLVRQFFAEGLVLALCGAFVAVLTARWSVAAIVALASHYFSDPGRIRPDATVFGFTLGLAGLAAVLLSMGVAWSASRVNVHETLKEGTLTTSGARRTLVMQQLLIVLQLSLACLLLVSASGMIQGLAKLSRVSPGFDAHHVLTMRVPLPPQNNSPSHPAWLFFGPALERIKALPGVKAAAVITYLPMQNWGTNSGFQVQGRPKVAQNEEPWAEVRAISPDYFRVMDIHLLQGRWFSSADTVNSENVLVVNRTFVRKYFPNENVLGQRIDFTDEGHWQTIVGIVDDSHQTGLEPEVLPEADEPCTQANWAYLTQTMSLAVRTEGDPLLLAKPVEQAIYSQDPSQAVYGVKTMDDVIAETEADQRFVLWLLGLFAALAVLLACSGLFGQISYAVGQRTHEIGIRLALGAQRGRIAKMILRHGGWLVGAGLAAGLAASFGLTKLMASLLYGVKPAGFVATAASVALLGIVGLLACYIPARRAMKVDPMIALRHE